ncbi:MAG TPA: glycosyltransferase family 4 protein, partial [Vicinamibacterales bacterium]|nr:glycosyltransferase family 4 protein [Vicinamibacterales bacterium]
VPKGVDSNRFQPTGESHRRSLGLDGKRVVLGVGRFVPIKNMALLIDAFATMAASDAQAHLVLIGEGPEQANLKALVDRRGVAARVTFVGYVAQDDLAPYYRSADLFVLSSDFDNSPNVVLEAMACGVPVVATDVGGVKEYVSPEGGELVRKQDVAALSSALLRWLEDPQRRQAAGTFNRRRVVEAFSWRASAQRLLQIYESVLSARRDMKVPA